MVIVVIRAIQKPKIKPLMTNFFFLRRLIWRIAIWVAAPMTNRTRNTALMGSSTCFVGSPPSPAVVGRYGGPLGACACSHVSTVHMIITEDVCSLLLDWTLRMWYGILDCERIWLSECGEARNQDNRPVDCGLVMSRTCRHARGMRCSTFKSQRRGDAILMACTRGRIAL